MSRRDDDYEDDDDLDDIEEEDDEGGLSGSTSRSNPFSSGGASVRGAGLPRPSSSEGGSGSTSPFGNRPSEGGGSGSGGAGGAQPFNRSPLSGGSGGSGLGGGAPKPPAFGGGSGSGGSGAFNRPGGDRPTTPGLPSRPAPRSDDDDDKDDKPTSGGGLGGIISRSPLGGGNKPDDKKDDKPASGGGLGGLASRSPFGSGNKPDDKKDDKPSGGGGLGGLASRSPFGSGNKPDDKKDDKPSGGGLGGLASRSPFGSGNKPDDKKDDKPSGGGLGGLASRLPIGGGNKPDDKKDSGKKDDKPSGGGLGGLASRLPIGGGGNKPDDKKDSGKKDDKPSGGGLSGALGGLSSRLPIGGGNKPDDKKDAGKKDDKPSGGGLGGAVGGALGGLAARSPFGGGNKPDDKKDDKTAGGGLGSRLPGLGGQSQNAPPRPGAPTPGTPTSGGLGGAPRPGGLGGGTAGGAGGSTLGGAPSPFGAQKSGAPAKGGDKKPAKAAAGGVSLTDRLRALNPFAATGKDKAAKPRTNKGVKVEQEGLTLDNKLDIAGIIMVIGSLILLLSSLSPTKGVLTESINGSLSYAFGWGAVAVVIAIFGIGVWLLARHFGDEAPTVSSIRLVGFAILFIGVLALAQFIDAMQYAVGTGQDYLQTVHNIFLPIAYSMGRGGGYVGGEIYFLLLSNVGEVGGFLFVILLIVIGIMLSLNLSVSDIAMIVISNARNLQDANKRRAQRVAAQRAQKQELLAAAAAAAAATAALNAAKQPKLPEALPVSSTPALPVPTQAALPLAAAAPEEQRSISISTGGRTSTVTFPSGESVPMTPGIPVTGLPPQPQTLPVQPAATLQPSQPPAAPGRGGLFGGLPRIGGSKAEPDEKKPLGPPLPAPANAAEDKAGRRGLFGLGGGQVAKPAVPAAASTQTTPAAQPNTQPSGIGLGAAAAAGAAAGLAAGAAASLLGGRDENKPQTFTPTTPAPASLTSSAPRELPAAQPNTPTAPNGTGTPPLRGAQAAAARLSESARLGDAARGIPAPERSDIGTSVSQPVERPAAVAASSPAAPSMPAATPTPAAIPAAASLGSQADWEPTPAATPSRPQPFQRPALGSSRPSGDGDQPAKPESPVDRSALPSFKGTPELYAPGNPLRQGGSAPAASGGTLAGSPPPAPPSARAALTGEGNVQPERERAVPAPPPPRRTPKEWKLPDQATLLASGDDQEVDHELLLKRARIIEETLSSFGAPGRVVDVRTGPVVTQFGVEPDYIEVRGGKKNRVKVGAIAALDKDMQLALGAKSIRIEAPVPGKGYVGIEVPNEKAEIVRLRDVLEAEQFKKIRTKSPLGIALGQGVDGTPVAADLTSMPHLLIAGTTGSGKSVCVNAIISSLLLNNTPRQVKFIMVDPKRVELTQYNGIPHLIAPVVVELERIVSVLKWVTREMDERYRKFSQAAARNIEDFNKHLPATEDPMPYIVVIIDELADLMMLAPDETERVITRIAALARATGIHLVIATQRPSVDVVTGLIKANFPARVAFAVAGSVDSRVILDQPGAERLLGRGDMLYMSGDSPAPQRLQGVFVSDQEISNVTRFWRGQVTEEELMAMFKPLGATLTAADDEADKARSGSGNAIFSRSAGGSSSSTSMPWERGAATSRRDQREDDDDEEIEDDDDGDDVGDEMYEQAVEMVRRLNRASVSLLQRRLRIGYTRAARLIDMMEERGVVGPATEGSKPREVLPER